MIRLTYTAEMENNDKLWETEDEDIELMKRLYQEIYDEAVEKGFKELIFIYDGTGEAIVEVYYDENHKEECELGNAESEMYGFCKPFIQYIERVINS